MKNPARAATIQFIDPRSDAAWLKLLEHPSAGLFHSPPWLCALADTYGFDIRAYLLRDSSESPLGGVAFCQLDDICGQRLVTLPFSDACNPLVSAAWEWRLLFQQLQVHKVPIHLRCLADSIIATESALSIAKTSRWHRLTLAASSLDELWAGLSGAVRRAIRKAMRLGVTIRLLKSPADREAFVRLHVATRKRKYRLLAQPTAFFEAIARHFDEVNGWLPLGAYLGDRLLAATVYLRWRDTLYYKFNASDLDALEARPNNMLGWAGILLGRSLGCTTLDLGPSDDDQPGLIRFKQGFGAKESELRFLRWTPSNWQDEQAPAAHKLLSEMTRQLTAPSVGDEVTARAGDFLYRYFS